MTLFYVGMGILWATTLEGFGGILGLYGYGRLNDTLWTLAAFVQLPAGAFLAIAGGVFA